MSPSVTAINGFSFYFIEFWRPKYNNVGSIPLAREMVLVSTIAPRIPNTCNKTSQDSNHIYGKIL